jgi:hypothetical protein
LRDLTAPRPPGLFALYVAGYPGYRIFEETIRIDSSARFLGLRLNFFVAVVMTLAGLAWFAISQPAGHAAGKKARMFPEPGVQDGDATACSSDPRCRRAPVVSAAQRLGVKDVEQPFAWWPRTTVTSTTTL